MLNNGDGIQFLQHVSCILACQTATEQQINSAVSAVREGLPVC